MSSEKLKENVRIYGIAFNQVPPITGVWTPNMKSVPCEEEFNAYVESIHSPKNDTPRHPKLKIWFWTDRRWL